MEFFCPKSLEQKHGKGKMENLINVKNEEAVTTSLQIAEKFEKRHKDVLRAIENLVAQNCAAKKMFKRDSYKDERGKEQPVFFMNRDGFSLLAMGFNGKKALEWKLKYIEAFNAMEKILMEKHTQTWLDSRLKSKLTRKAETDVLKKFVEYARENGSGNADKYYIIFSTLANKAANVTNRNMATTFQLNSLTFIESIILHTVECQLLLGTDYHEIYQKCKKAIDEFKDLTDYKCLAIS